MIRTQLCRIESYVTKRKHIVLYKEKFSRFCQLESASSVTFAFLCVSTHVFKFSYGLFKVVVVMF